MQTKKTMAKAIVFFILQNQPLLCLLFTIVDLYYYLQYLDNKKTELWGLGIMEIIEINLRHNVYSAVSFSTLFLTLGRHLSVCKRTRALSVFF